MGIFDFFRSKRQDSTEPPISSQFAAEDLVKSSCCHYTFAHYALRSVAFENPLAFLGILGSPEANNFLDRLLQVVAEQCQEREPQPDFGVADITIHHVRTGQYPCVIIQMPPPKAVAEAHFTAAVLLADLKRGVPETGSRSLRYFTLEKGITLGGPPRTVLCEWTADGGHLNYGDGPEPQVEKFIRAIEKVVS